MCKELHTNLTPSRFHKIQFEELNGFCVACSSEITNDSSLLMQFLYSAQTNYNVSVFDKMSFYLFLFFSISITIIIATFFIGNFENFRNR